jgi:DNA-binding transcriptional ArsR family regulator
MRTLSDRMAGAGARIDDVRQSALRSERTTGDNRGVALRIDIAGLRPSRVLFAVSPLAELTAMLHVLVATEHHPNLTGWAAAVRVGLRPELAERLQEAEFLWGSSRADFLIPGQPRETLKEELDDVDLIPDETYVSTALITTCGSNRVHFGGASPLTDPVARERALDQAQARGAIQEAFAERLLADPRVVRARVRETMEQCTDAFFDAVWPGIATRITADLRVKTDLRDRHGLGAALAAVSRAIALAPDGNQIIVDTLRDRTMSANGLGIVFIPSVFGSPHLTALHCRGSRPVVQYPITTPGQAAAPVSMAVVERRLDALAHPVRLRLVRTLARSPHTTSELALAWDLTPPEVSRHLAVLRRAGLVTVERHGRFVHYAVDYSALTTLGMDLLAAVLR